MHVWVLLNESWLPDQEEAEEGQSLFGVFASRERALAYLSDEIIGAEGAAAIVWTCSPHHDGYWEGRRDYGLFGELWRLIREDVQGG